MDFEDIVSAIEAILFAAGEAVGIERLCKALEADDEEIKSALTSLSSRLDKTNSSIMLTFAEGKAQLCTRNKYADYVRSALEVRRAPTLSTSALETLAVVAYRQPVTKSYIEQVRGVDSSYTVASLAEKGLIEECGRLEVPGRPILYKTTRHFMHVFGLSSLDDLPREENADKDDKSDMKLNEPEHRESTKTQLEPGI